MRDEEFQRLTTLYLEGSINANDLEKLNQELGNSPKRIRQFNDLRLLTGLIFEHGQSVVEPELSTSFFIMYWKSFAAIAACLAIGIGVWFINRPAVPVGPSAGAQPEPKKPPIVHVSVKTVMLAPGWLGEPRDADYEITSPGTVRLTRGELYIKSVAIENLDFPRQPLRIETPEAVATATGTEFYVETKKTKQRDKKNMKSITSVLVLSGVVTLANAYGTVSGSSNDRLVADANSAPINQTVNADDNTEKPSEFEKKMTKKFTLVLDNVTLKKALSLLQDKSGVSISYSGKNGDKKVSLDSDKFNLKDGLKWILRQTRAHYVIMDDGTVKVLDSRAKRNSDR
jgi:hypothetical protein